MSKKILIIDDDADILEMVGLVLSKWGYETEMLCSGKDVFENINIFQPDLILMDVMLADMDGRVICSAIEENLLIRSLPVILISATHDLAQSLLQQGAPNDFVAKPFDINYLHAKIGKQLAA